LPGIITQRHDTFRPPGKRAINVGAVVNVICIASSCETSTTSGTPVRDARVHAVSVPSAAKAPVMYSPSRPPTVIGERCMCPWFARLPHRACSACSVNSRSSSGPPWPIALMSAVTAGCGAGTR
jgi:hypothetical protein